MTCDHHPPQFDCGDCVEKRGKIFENDTDYYMYKLHLARDKLIGSYEIENVEEVYNIMDSVIEDMEEIIIGIRADAQIDPDQVLLHEFISDISRYRKNNGKIS